MNISRILVLAALTAVICVSSSECGWYRYGVTDGLPSNYVHAIFEDSSGNLWFGTDGGVSRYDGVVWRTFTTDNGLAHNEVWAILEDDSGNLWFGTCGGGVSRYDGVSWRTFTTADGLASNCVFEILEDSTGDLWFATNGNRVSRYNGEGWTTLTLPGGHPPFAAQAMIEDSSGNLWFGTLEGVSRYDGVGWRTFTYSDGLAGNNVQAILEDREGNLWFGMTGGVSRYDGASWRTFTMADGLASNLVYAMLEDRQGNLWFMTESGGVNRYDGEYWRTFAMIDGLAENQVAAICEDHSGALWFGTQYSGVSRYDGVSWHTFTTADGLAGNYVYAILEDRVGNLWFGTQHGGVSRYDGVSWRTFTEADGLAYDIVNEILEDHSGNLWFATGGGASRYDGVSWRTFTTDDGLASNWVNAILEDSSGNLWFGTHDGVSRYDGVGWVTFTTADGLASNTVYKMLEDRFGNLWFGTYGGVSRYDGVAWHTFTMADGLASNYVYAMLEDRFGNLWFGTPYGVSHYDGVTWVTFTMADGLASNYVYAMLEDRTGNLWFGTLGVGGGVTRHEADHVHPQTVISPRPPELSANTISTITFAAAFREVEGIKFSHSFDGSPWTEWSPTDFCQAVNLSDGEHVFMVKARDRMGNVDSTAAVCTFEIDASPPVPVVVDPAFGVAVRGVVPVRGTAADLRFRKYRIDVRSFGVSSWDSLFESASPVLGRELCAWDTESFSDGNYELRLSVADTLGLTGVTLVSVIVDNHAPWANETVPAVVSSANGGDVYTTNGEVHLYFPPRAFAGDTEVNIVALSDSLVPDTLADGAVSAFPGYEISWGGVGLRKPATLEMSCADAGPQLTLYVLGGDSTWLRIGGTVDVSSGVISSPLTGPGRYALFLEPPGAGTPGAGALSALSLTPRVFSPSGEFANDHVAIGFTLGRPAALTVKVYNRAGRLVRELMSGEAMGAGATLVKWNGRDSAGEIVGEGLYLVSVEALGHSEVKTVSIVR